jgi:hypothetical protein
VQLRLGPYVGPPPAVKSFGLTPRAIQPKMVVNLGMAGVRGTAVQRKILKDISTKDDDVGADERVISLNLYQAILSPFLYDKIASHPNLTMEQLFAELELDAFGNPHMEGQVARVKREFWLWVDSLVRKNWGTVKNEWKKQDDRIEKLYLMCKQNKAMVPGVDNKMTVSTQRDAEIKQAGTDAWRAKGKYGGLRSRLPVADEHYVVGQGTKDGARPGPMRVYTQNVHLTDGNLGVRAFYSPTHGDSRAPKAVEEALVSNSTIGGRRVVAPWDPYL